MMTTPRTTRKIPCTAVAVEAEEAVMVAVVALVVAGATVDVAVAAEEDAVAEVAPSLALARVAAATAAKTVERPGVRARQARLVSLIKTGLGFRGVSFRTRVL